MPRTSSAGSALTALLLVLAAASMAGILPPLLDAAILAVAALILPGSALAALCGEPRSPSRELLVGPALAPLLAGAAVIAADLAGMAPERVMQGLVLVAGAIVLFVRDRSTAPGPAEPDRRAWVAGALLATAVASILVSSPYRRETSDAVFHSAVVFEMERAGLPPQDPYFAGLPLQYFWFFHAALLGFGRLTGLAPPEVMALLNITAAALLVPAAARLALALGFSRLQGAAAGTMLLLGMGGLFWLFFPVKLLTALGGEIRGAEALGYIFRLRFTPESTSAFTQIFLSSGFFLRKFLVGTAASWGILLVIVAAGHGLRHVAAGGRRELPLFFLAASGALLLHVVLGGACLAALGGGAGLAWIARRAPRRALWLPALFAAAVLAALPYLRGVTAAKEGTNLLPVGFDSVAVLSLPFTLAGVAVLAVPALRGLARGGGGTGAVFLGWLLLSTLYALVARLPGPNQYDKPPIVPYLPLAVAAGAVVPLLWSRWAARPRRRRAFAIFLVLFLVPENSLLWAGFFGARSAPAIPAADAALHAWIGRETPRDAVFLDSDDRTDVLVRGPRRQYWGIEAYARQWGYPAEEMDRRRAIRDALMAGRVPEEAPDALRGLGSPVYVIVRAGEAPAAGPALAAHPAFRKAYDGNGIAVYRLEASVRAGG